MGFAEDMLVILRRNRREHPSLRTAFKRHKKFQLAEKELLKKKKLTPAEQAKLHEKVVRYKTESRQLLTKRLLAVLAATIVIGLLVFGIIESIRELPTKAFFPNKDFQ